MKSREPRHRFILPAKMRWDGGWVVTSVRDVSLHGVMVSGPVVPPRGAYVDLVVGSLMVTARTMWSEGANCGLLARTEIDIDRLRNGPVPDRRIAKKAGFGKAGEVERRIPDHRAQAEKSRNWSNAMQYFAAMAVYAALGIGLGWEVYKTLSAPAAAISTAMAAPR